MLVCVSPVMDWRPVPGVSLPSAQCMLGYAQAPRDPEQE